MAYNPPPAYIQPARTSTMAIISLIAGIAGLSIFPTLGSIVAVVTGHMARGEIRRSNGMVTGDGLALAGLIVGYVGLGLTLLVICGVILWFVFIAGLIGYGIQQSSQLAPLAFVL
jgi:hypothetical protein